MATLTRDRLTYLCATEEEATDLIEDFKASQDSEHYLLSCYKADFKKQEHKAQQSIVNEYAAVKKLAKIVEVSSLKNDADYEVAKNILLVDIWSKKFLQAYKPSEEELKNLYLEQKPTVVAKYELRNIFVNYEKNADK